MTPTELKTLANKHRGTGITFYEAYQQELPAKTLYEAIADVVRPLYLFCDLCDTQANGITRDEAIKQGWTFGQGAEFCNKHY